MAFPIYQLHSPFIKGMVFAMYVWEAKQHDNPDLCTDLEIYDFYNAYMGGPL
jgi:hypothetical protein